MSYKKWIYKYQFLKEDLKDLQNQEKKNIKEFNDTFNVSTETPPEDNSSSIVDNTPPQKIKNNPGKPLYKSLSKKLHPDRGGDTEEFAEISIMYRDQDTIGLYLKAENIGINVKEFINEELIKSFEKSCEIVEKECTTITGTISWAWCNTNNELEKKKQLNWIKKNLGLSPKKK